MQPSASLESRIKLQAQKLGFFQSGISSIGPVPNFGFFTRWLADGFHGEMSYLTRQAEKRCDPLLVFPDARSLLILGMNYFVNRPHPASALKGRISRYAWGADYHDVVLGRLKALLGFIRRQEPAADGRCHVDTGPVMEKAWGAQTALGWMGKNTNLISRQQGSWFFLGALLLNIPLKPDSREQDHCGTCRRCMDACPTGAIVAPYVLDARKCIAYLTIEFRGMIPRHLRPYIGNRVFGCDDCQDVCPWNRFSTETLEKGFSPADDVPALDLIAFARITPREFRIRFEKSPIYRATRDGFVRNVVTALGNSGMKEAVPVLEQALKDESALVRASSVWALWRVSQESARRLFLKIREDERNPLVLREIDNCISCPGLE